jgi:hypothetical protein
VIGSVVHALVVDNRGHGIDPRPCGAAGPDGIPASPVWMEVTCQACKDAHRAGQPTADETLDGRRFHRHARNCTWCKPVLEAEPGSDAAKPDGICEDGKVLLVKAIQAHQEGRQA